MKKTFLLTLFIFSLLYCAQAQIKLNAVVGGGQFNMKQFLDQPVLTKIDPGIKFQAGLLASTKFRKDGMLSIETGALLTYTDFKSFFIDNDPMHNGDIVWNEKNYLRTKSFFLTIPLTLDFNVYERFGILAGGHINARLSQNEDAQALRAVGAFLGSEEASYEKWIPGLHLGLYGNINNRFRLEGKVSSDILPRLHNSSYPDNPHYRELGFTLNLRYLLNP